MRCRLALGLAVLLIAPPFVWSVQPVFDPTGPSFYDLPFPHELRRDADGTVSIAAFPFPANPLVDQYRDAIEETPGFGIASAVFIKLDGAIDPASLPADPAASRAPGASVFLINVDPLSEGRGTRIPLWIDFRAAGDAYRDPNLLALMPVPGHVLDQGTLYAAVVTDGVLDTLAAPLTAPPAIQRLQAEAPVGGFETAALPLYQTLWQQLEGSEAVSRTHVVTATVFRTGVPAAPLADLVAKRRRPRLGNAALFGDFGSYWVVSGEVRMPQLQRGTPPFTEPGSGGFVLNRRGIPIVQRKEPVRVLVAVPKETPTVTMPEAGWPIATCMHGTGGSALSFINDSTAARLAQRGIASISFDQPLHGPRPGTPDDFYSPLNALAFRDNSRQSAVEGLLVHQLAGRLRRVRALPTGVASRIDPTRRLFFGHSQGATVGPLVMALAPEMRGGVLSAGGGHLLLNILTRESVLFAGLTARQLVELLLGTTVDAFHPALHLVQMGAEPSDPLAYADRFARDRDGPPLSVLFTHGLLDPDVTTPLTASMVIAAGYPLLAPTFPNRVFPAVPTYTYQEGFELAGLGTLTPPVTGNLGGTATGGLSLFELGNHFPVFVDPDAIAQWTGFMGSLAYDPLATIPARP
jgi:predicted esterase